jgi:hypothetical protein
MYSNPAGVRTSRWPAGSPWLGDLWDNVVACLVFLVKIKINLFRVPREQASTLSSSGFLLGQCGDSAAVAYGAIRARRTRAQGPCPIERGRPLLVPS